MRLDLHVLQSIPPANLNRDDTGSPKDAFFGGVRRTRLSSQSVKRAIRHSEAFRAALDGPMGTRSKRLAAPVAERLAAQGRDYDEAVAVAGAFMQALYGAGKEAKTERGSVPSTKYLVYAGEDDLDRAAALLAPVFGEALGHVRHLGAPAAGDGEATTEPETEAAEETPAKGGKKKGDKKSREQTAAEDYFKALAASYKKEAEKVKTVRAADIALFGRMLADDPSSNVDAACHVAHALSVDAHALLFDYFTAVDDLQPGDNAGAGMIGTVPFASSCFYRFATVDLGLLARTLGGAATPDTSGAVDAAMAFASAFPVTLPSGKQATFAAYTLPSLVLAVVRDGPAVSLANAFEQPVERTRTESLSAVAAQRLADHFASVTTAFNVPTSAAYVLCPEGQKVNKAASAASIDELLGKLRAALAGGAA